MPALWQRRPRRQPADFAGRTVTTFDEARRITLKGQLVLVIDPETWQAAILKNATILTD